MFSKRIILFMILSVSCVFAQERNDLLRSKLLNLTPDDAWEKVAEIPLRFNAFHTQGIVMIGDYFYMSSVETAGIGHIFKFDNEGNLLHDLLIGEGDVYHPGGIDYDGTYIWVSVAEYRPRSSAIIYKVNPETMIAIEVFRYNDHIGAIIHNTDDHTLTGVNWDARKIYHWTFDEDGKITNAHIAPEALGIPRHSYYVAFQDCKYIGGGMMFCSGLQTYNTETIRFALGGWEIIDLHDNRPIHQLPVKFWSPTGRAITNNPCTIESTPDGFRAYFVPDDDEIATLLIYQIKIPSYQ